MTPKPNSKEDLVPACPDYSRLYKLRDPFLGSPFRLGQAGPTRFNEEDLTALWGGDLVPSSPVAMRVTMGKRPADILWSTCMWVVAISGHVRELLLRGDFTGWSSYALDVRDRHSELLSGYSGLAITGRAGLSDWRRSTFTSKPAWSRGKPRDVLVGQYFLDDRWDGLDFCLVGFGGTAIVTQRVVDAFKRASIGNVKFTRLLDVETEVSTLRILGSWPLTASASAEASP